MVEGYITQISMEVTFSNSVLNFSILTPKNFETLIIYRNQKQNDSNSYSYQTEILNFMTELLLSSTKMKRSRTFPSQLHTLCTRCNQLHLFSER